MIVYKRKISNLYTIVGGISQEPITPGGPRIPGEDIVPPKSLLIYLTQNIEDLGIYEDVGGKQPFGSPPPPPLPPTTSDS